jgi:hypothetical protein
MSLINYIRVMEVGLMLGSDSRQESSKMCSLNRKSTVPRILYTSYLYHARGRVGGSITTTEMAAEVGLGITTGV